MNVLAPKSKIHLRKNLDKALATLPRPIVFTNGVFDILHAGHVKYLHEARLLGGSLVVAINSDRSARQLGKGPDRPLNRENDRAIVLASLEAVSLVTFFDERTPVDLIKEIHPDIYVKGGDYDMSTLEETTVVQSWGGRSFAIPFVDGYSTTSLVKRIQSSPSRPRKAAFLDRDGVINKDKAYVHSWEDFEFVPGAIDAMRRLKEAGYELVVVTNQSGIARGMYSEKEYQSLTQKMCEVLDKAGASLAGVFHCPHHPDGSIAEFAKQCVCRKPEPGLIQQAASQLNLDLKESILVGDKPSDIDAARAAGVGKAYRVNSDNIESQVTANGSDGSFANLSVCVEALLTYPANQAI